MCINNNNKNVNVMGLNGMGAIIVCGINGLVKESA